MKMWLVCSWGRLESHRISSGTREKNAQMSSFLIRQQVTFSKAFHFWAIVQGRQNLYAFWLPSADSPRVSRSL